MGKGPRWFFTMIRTNEKCLQLDQLIPSLLFVGNIFPHVTKPYDGCYQEAWPL
jgi:hypothetical protein